MPQVAMSAGTMIACSAREIVLGNQLILNCRGLPAQGVIDEFKHVLEAYKADPESLAVWRPILEEYSPTFLGQCKQAIDWTKAFVTDQLKSVMFDGDPEARQKADRIATALSDRAEHKAHERHISAAKCIEMGLRVRMLENDNHDGVAFVRQQTQPVSR